MRGGGAVPFRQASASRSAAGCGLCAVGELRFGLAELGEVLVNMRREDLGYPIGLDAEIGRDQRPDASRPIEPRVARSPRPLEEDTLRDLDFDELPRLSSRGQHRAMGECVGLDAICLGERRAAGMDKRERVFGGSYRVGAAMMLSTCRSTVRLPPLWCFARG